MHSHTPQRELWPEAAEFADPYMRGLEDGVALALHLLTSEPSAHVSLATEKLLEVVETALQQLQARRFAALTASLYPARFE